MPLILDMRVLLDAAPHANMHPKDAFGNVLTTKDTVNHKLFRDGLFDHRYFLGYRRRKRRKWEGGECGNVVPFLGWDGRP